MRLYRKKYVRLLSAEMEKRLVMNPESVVDMKSIVDFQNEVRRSQQSKLPFTERTLRILDRLQTDSCQPKYTLVPLNVLLWLYNLGLSEERSYELFTGIAKGIALARKAKRVAHEGFMAVPAPLTDRALELLHSADASFSDEKNRNFGMLQALLAMFVCSVAGKNEHERTSRLLADIAPDMFRDLGTVPMPKTKEPGHMYANAYTPARSVPWLCVLLQVAELPRAVLTCKVLTLKAEKILANPVSTRGMTGTEMLTRVYTYLKIAQCGRPEESRKFAFMGGKYGFW